MKRIATAAVTLLVAFAAASACSGSPPPASSSGTAQAAEAPAAAPAIEPSAAPKLQAVAEQAPAPAATPAKAPAAAAAARIEVEPTKPGLTRIGADKCKMCHKAQFTSWAESAHAKQTPPLDCESCHGPGSEYKAVAVMKDPAKAKEAGLVIPGASFCTAKCHTKGWSDDLIKKVHAHKAS